MANHIISLLSGSVLNDTGAGNALVDLDPLGGILTVNADGFLISAPPAALANGVELSGGKWTVNIKGAVGTFTPGSGLFLSGSSAISPDVITVDTTGSLFGAATGGYGIYAERTFTLTNKGTIDGKHVGVGSFSGASTITNSGVIEGDTYGVLFNVVAGTNTITNSGTIRGGTAILDAVGGADKVTNSKTIIGDVKLFTGGDTLKNTGTITGAVGLGDGINFFTNGKIITGNVSTGVDVDTLMNTGTITGTVNTGDGADTFTNTGTVTGIIDLGKGADTYKGSAKAETVTDNDGADSYKLGAGNDTFIAIGATLGSDGIDTIDGVTGIDTYDASGAASPVLINLSTTPPLTSVWSSVPGSTAWGLDVSGEAVTGLVLPPPPTAYDRITGFENAKGGSAEDYFFGSLAANVLEGNGGVDRLFGYGGNDILDGGADGDELSGGTGSDVLKGGGGGDQLHGDDFLSLVGGNDTLDGGDDADGLYGGVGADKLTGGTGPDAFLFLHKRESGLTATTRDTITDFEGSGAAGGDFINLSAIDADERAISSGDQAFTFTASDGFGAFTVGTAGQLRFQITAAGTVVYGETTGDGKADFSILVQGIHHFSTINGEDFFL